MLVNKKNLLSVVERYGNRDELESMVEYGMEPGDCINMGDADFLYQEDVISNRTRNAINSEDDSTYQRVLLEVGIILGIR